MLISNETALLAVAAIERPLFSLDGQTLISVGIQLFNAVVLAFALRHFLYKPVSKFMKKRTDRIKDQMSAAEDGVKEADALKALYEQKIAELEQERYSVLAAAKTQAAETTVRMIDDAKAEIADMRERAAAELRSERDRADKELKQYVVDVAAHMAGKFVAHSMDESTLERLFDESMSELEAAL